MKEKVVLAYSGGLDTSVIIPWLQENYNFDVIAVAVDVGQKDDFKAVEEKAYKIGATKFYAVDKKAELVNDYIFPMIKSGAKYENTYLFRNINSKTCNRQSSCGDCSLEGANYIVHGATGKGNDQVRFELGIKALAPNMKIIAPWRIWDIKSRTQEIELFETHGIELPFKETVTYSRDENLFHISHEGQELESPANSPDYENVLQWVLPLEKASDTPESISIEFVKGVPVKLNERA